VAAASGQLLDALLAAFGVLLTGNDGFDGLCPVLLRSSPAAWLRGCADEQPAGLDSASAGGDIRARPGRLTVQDLVDRLLREQPEHRAFEVVDVDGECWGLRRWRT
jgi:hypothetical protein